MPMPPHPPSAIDWLAGGALGLLLGLLVGLSASPVVSSVVVGLVALLAGVFGLSEKFSLTAAAAHRLATFALAAAVALIGGLHLRTHQLMAPDVNELRRQLVEIDITDAAEQKQMLRFMRFGLLPAGTTAVGKDGEGARQLLAAAQPLLYANSATFCGPLRRLVQERAPLSDLLLHLGSGAEAARRAVAAINALPEPERLAAARLAPLYLCAL